MPVQRCWANRRRSCIRFRSTRCVSVKAEHLGVSRAAISMRNRINVLFFVQIFEVRWKSFQPNNLLLLEAQTLGHHKLIAIAFHGSFSRDRIWTNTQEFFGVAAYNRYATRTDTASMPSAAEWIVYILCASQPFLPLTSWREKWLLGKVWATKRKAAWKGFIMIKRD